MDWLICLIPLAAGYALDKLLGDPAWLPHPVVLFGKMIAAAEHRLNKGKRRVAKGAVTAVVLIAATYLATFLLLKFTHTLLWLNILIQTILVFYCLAGTTLSREVRDVEKALGRSLDAGRRQVGRIVGRDTAKLSGQEVRTAAIETLAENFSDGIVAPLFWYVLLGVPGMLAYKMVNTLDSMIGYRTERYRLFGRWAARIDDVANYVPARISALLLAAASPRKGLLGFIATFASCHASPNSGWPEAAMAGILDCRFGGPHDYFGERIEKPYIGINPRPLTAADTGKALRVAAVAEPVAVVIALLLL